MAVATDADLVARVKREALKATAAAGEAVRELRDRIHDLKDELHALDRHPCSRSEAEERLRMATADHGRAAGKLAPLLEASPPVPNAPINAVAYDLRQLTAADLLGAMAPDALAAWAMAQLDRQAAALGGWNELDELGRDSKRHALAADLLELERQEEALILAAEEVGLTIRRRPDADPRAVLGLDEESTVEAGMTPQAIQAALRAGPPPAMGSRPRGKAAAAKAEAEDGDD